MVKKIFTLCMNGRGPSQIAEQLEREKILTPYALRELVKAVYVEAPDKSSGKRKQKVHIEYDLVGYIPVDELIKAEQA